MQQDSEDIQEQDNEPNANVVQSDNEQEQIVDSNSSPENSDDTYRKIPVQIRIIMILHKVTSIMLA